jgi:hypothetical protein
MSWFDDANHPFAGIAEKLKRANQNIVNLDAEIREFIEKGEYPVVPHPDDEKWQEAVNYHRSKPIPLRFSVLAGEVVHHLRSSLDHIVWHFSTEEARRKAQNVIEFPVFEFEPLDEKQLERYERKIQGITNTRVRNLIQELQPYKAGKDIANDPILIVHNMDRFDKHRELVIVRSSVLIQLPATESEIARKFALYTEGKLPTSEYASVSRALKQHGTVTPNIAFNQFGDRKSQPVVLGLAQLFDEISIIVEIFATVL